LFTRLQAVVPVFAMLSRDDPSVNPQKRVSVRPATSLPAGFDKNGNNPDKKLRQ